MRRSSEHTTRSSPPQRISLRAAVQETMKGKKSNSIYIYIVTDKKGQKMSTVNEYQKFIQKGVVRQAKINLTGHKSPEQDFPGSQMENIVNKALEAERTGEIENVEERIRNLELEIETKNMEIEELNQKVEGNEEKLKEWDVITEKLKERKNKLEQELEDLQEMGDSNLGNEGNEEINHTATDSIRLQRDIEDQNVKIQSYRQSQKSLETQKIALLEAREKIQNSQNEKEYKLEEISANLQENDSEIIRLNGELNTQRDILKSLGEVEGNYTKLQDDHTSSRVLIQDLRHKNETTKTKIMEIESALRDFQSKGGEGNTNLDEKLQKVKSKKRNLKSELKGKSDQIIDLLRCISKGEGEIQGEKEKNSIEKTKIIQGYQVNIEDSNTQIGNLKREKTKLEIKVSEIQDKLQKMDTDIENKKSTIAELEEKERNQKLIVEEHNKVKDIEINNLMERQESEKLDEEENIKGLTKTCENYEKELELKSKDLFEGDTKCKTLEDEIDRLSIVSQQTIDSQNNMIKDVENQLKSTKIQDSSDQPSKKLEFTYKKTIEKLNNDLISQKKQVENEQKLGINSELKIKKLKAQLAEIDHTKFENSYKNEINKLQEQAKKQAIIIENLNSEKADVYSYHKYM